MAATVAPFMPSAAEIAACRWLTDAEVAVYAGEFARILERKTVGADVRGANPGEWVRIRTIIQPREGWITPDHTRPVPEN